MPPRSVSTKASGRNGHRCSTTSGPAPLRNRDVQSEVLRKRDEQIGRMQNDAKTRAKQHQVQIESEFEANASAIETQIEDLRKEYEAEASRTNEENLSRLRALLARKLEIEGNIIEETRVLAKAHLQMRAELSAIIDGRAKDVQEAMALIDQMKSDGGSEGLTKQS